jgi:hypothetical protein
MVKVDSVAALNNVKFDYNNGTSYYFTTKISVALTIVLLSVQYLFVN